MNLNSFIPSDRFSELIPVLAIDSESKIFWLEGKCVAFGFIFSPLAGADHSAGDRLAGLLNNNWPKGTMIQVLNFITPDLTLRLEIFRERREAAYQETLRKTREKYANSPADLEARLEQADRIKALYERQIEFLQNGTEQPLLERDRLRVSDAYCVVTVRIPIADKFPTQEEIDRASRNADSVKSTLNTTGGYAAQLDQHTWVRVMQVVLNGSKQAPWRHSSSSTYDPDLPLRDQVLDPGSTIEITKDGITLDDDRRIRFLCVKKLPEYCYFGMAQEYLADFQTGARGIRDNAVFFTTIYFNDAESERTKFEGERAWVTHQAFGPMTKFSNRLSMQKRSFDALATEVDEGDRIVRVWFGMALMTTPQEEPYAVANAINYFRERHFTMLEDRFTALPSLLNILPFCADPAVVPVIQRFKRMGTRHCVDILPLFGEWKGTPTPSMAFISRSGQLMYQDLFDSPSSFNGVCIAQSGAGKSVWANYLTQNTLAFGGRVWTIDVGRSYEKLCNAINGQYISFTRDSNICMNPFPLVKDYAEEADILLGLILSMAFYTQVPDDYQISSVRKALSDLWAAHGQTLNIDLIADALAKNPNPRITDIAQQLYAFTSAGEYGKYFNGPNNVRFDNPYVLIELEELKSRLHLQKVVLLQFIYQIQQECYLGDRDQRKVVIVDEAWSLLTEGEVGKFLEGAYRRFRKYGAACVVVTQGIDDLYNTPNGAAIAANSPNMFLLKQKPEVIERAREAKKLSIPDWAFNKLVHVHTAKDVYSEIFFINELGMGIGRLINDPYANRLFNTNAREFQKIRDLMAQGYSQDQAIRHLMGDTEALAQGPRRTPTVNAEAA